MDMIEPSFDASTFSKNRQRLMAHDVAGELFAAVVKQAQQANLMSSEHFSVDGTLIDAWASLKSFRKKDGSDDDESKGNPSNRWVNFRGDKRSNETHESKTDPEATLMRKGRGKESKLSFSAHALMENRNGLLADIRVGQATGTAERDVAEAMLDDLGATRRVTVGADKAYDTRAFVAACRQINVTPHVAQHQHARRTSAIDARTTSHPGYAVSQRLRMRCEEIFGWMKTIGGLRKTRHKGVERTQLDAHLVGSAYNLLRMANLMAAST